MSLLTIVLVICVIGICYGFNYYKNEERRRIQNITKMWNEVKEAMPPSEGKTQENTVADLDPVVRRAKERIIEDRNLRTGVEKKPRTRPPSRRKSHMSKPRTPMKNE